MTIIYSYPPENLSTCRKSADNNSKGWIQYWWVVLWFLYWASYFSDRNTLTRHNVQPPSTSAARKICPWQVKMFFLFLDSSSQTQWVYVMDTQWLIFPACSWYKIAPRPWLEASVLNVKNWQYLGMQVLVILPNSNYVSPVSVSVFPSIWGAGEKELLCIYVSWILRCPLDHQIAGHLG